MPIFTPIAGHILGLVTDNIRDAYVPTADLENQVTSLTMRTVLTASVVLVVLVLITVAIKDKHKRLKPPLFIMIITTMVLSTLMLLASTVYLNVKADSGGPVHWHADFEIWACGNQLELRDPTGLLSNKIGTATLHEHNDQRIHLEGVVVHKKEDASLGKFFHVVGGTVTDSALVVPLNKDEAKRFENQVDGDGPAAPNPDQVRPYIVDDGDNGQFARFFDGQTCGNEQADVQVFVYNYDQATKTYRQHKVTRPQDYVITGDSNVPPGDCVIVEFAPTKDTTDKLCEQYGVRDIDRCATFGVKEDERQICQSKEVKAIEAGGMQ